VPSIFLLAALALTCSDLRGAGRAAWLAWVIPAASAAVFAWFFPILAALPLARTNSYLVWAWLQGWK
jgi:type IV secretory pathway component VirB8